MVAIIHHHPRERTWVSLVPVTTGVQLLTKPENVNSKSGAAGLGSPGFLHVSFAAWISGGAGMQAQ